MGLGGFMGGYLFDLSGNYNWSYGFAAVAGAINLTILTLFYLRLRTKRDPPNLEPYGLASDKGVGS